MKNIKQYAGIFYISHDTIVHTPELVLLIMKDVIITRAECIYHTDQIKYTGLSEKYFDMVPNQGIIPEYVFEIKRDIVGLPPEYTVLCKKID